MEVAWGGSVVSGAISRAGQTEGAVGTTELSGAPYRHPRPCPVCISRRQRLPKPPWRQNPRGALALPEPEAAGTESRPCQRKDGPRADDTEPGVRKERRACHQLPHSWVGLLGCLRCEMRPEWCLQKTLLWLI